MFVLNLLGGEFDGEPQEAPPGLGSSNVSLSQSETIVCKAATQGRSLHGRDEPVYYRLRTFETVTGLVVQFVWDGICLARLSYR